MSDIKSTVSRIHPGRTSSPGDVTGRHTLNRLHIDVAAQVRRHADIRGQRRSVEPTHLSEFIAPPSETAEWLGSPAIGSVLTAISGDLAPDGKASSKRDQYVASVVETHLVSRRQLAKHLNALLRA